jgi:hypothetical protein
MTIRFRCYALASNESTLDAELARRRGIDGFVEKPQGTVLDVDGVPAASLRSHVAAELGQRIEDARQFGADLVILTLGHRDSWTDEDLIAVDLGLLDGAAALPAHPIDRAYPPANVRH